MLPWIKARVFEVERELGAELFLLVVGRVDLLDAHAIVHFDKRIEVTEYFICVSLLFNIELCCIAPTTIWL